MKTYLFKNRIASIATCFLVTVCSSLVVGAATPALEKTRALLVERVKALEELVQLSKGQYQSGQALLDDYLSAENDLLEAKMELVSDHLTRIALRRKSVKNRTMMESIVAERVASGVASRADHLRARAARLKAEIALARELEKRGVDASE